MIFNMASGGGGGGIDLTVVGGLTPPTTPKENMIWIHTDIPITVVEIRGNDTVLTTPVGETINDGYVRILRGASSGANVSIGRKCILTMKLGSTYVYKGGKGTLVSAWAYKNGRWIKFSFAPVYLYKNGDQCTDITGGWFNYSGSKLGTDSILLSNSAVLTKKRIPRMLGSALYVKMNISKNTGNVISGLAESPGNNADGYLVSATQASGKTGEITARITDIPSTGNAYVKLFANNAAATITEVYYE